MSVTWVRQGPPSSKPMGHAKSEYADSHVDPKGAANFKVTSR